MLTDILHSFGYKTFGVTISPFVAATSRGYDEFTYLDRESARNLMFSRDRRALADFAALVLKHGSIRNIESMGLGYLLNRVTKRWIEKYHDRGSLFALVHYSAHWPYAPPEPFLSQFLGDFVRSDVEDVKRDVYELMGEGNLEQKLQVLRALYDGQIGWADACIGDLLRYLKSAGLIDNSIVIITSDHGDMLGEHGLLFHEFALYEPLIRVPFLLRFPDLYRKGKQYDGLVQTLDILPTLLDYLEIEHSNLTEDIQGKSLLKLVEEKDSRSFAISERSDWTQGGIKARKLGYLERTYKSFDWRECMHEVAIRTRKLKYLRSLEGRGELYNIENDPGECTNLISLEPHKAVELTGQIDKWRSSFTTAKQAMVESELDRFAKEKLRKLGYL
jgi:arylsulfatase A-like enzyme